jgi:hypothetical protein
MSDSDQVSASNHSYPADDEVLLLQEVEADLVLAVWEPTGDSQVDAALEQLATLDDLDTSEHISVFETVHRQLHQRLSDLNTGS